MKRNKQRPKISPLVPLKLAIPQTKILDELSNPKEKKEPEMELELFYTRPIHKAKKHDLL